MVCWVDLNPKMAKPQCTKKAVLRLTTLICLRPVLDCQNEELRGFRKGEAEAASDTSAHITER